MLSPGARIETSAAAGKKGQERGAMIHPEGTSGDGFSGYDEAAACRLPVVIRRSGTGLPAGVHLELPDHERRAALHAPAESVRLLQEIAPFSGSWRDPTFGRLGVSSPPARADPAG